MGMCDPDKPCVQCGRTEGTTVSEDMRAEIARREEEFMQAFQRGGKTRIVDTAEIDRKAFMRRVEGITNAKSR